MNFTVWEVKTFRLNSVAAPEMPVLQVGRAPLA